MSNKETISFLFLGIITTFLSTIWVIYIQAPDILESITKGKSAEVKKNIIKKSDTLIKELQPKYREEVEGEIKGIVNTRLETEKTKYLNKANSLKDKYLKLASEKRTKMTKFATSEVESAKKEITAYANEVKKEAEETWPDEIGDEASTLGMKIAEEKIREIPFARKLLGLE